MSDQDTILVHLELKVSIVRYIEDAFFASVLDIKAELLGEQENTPTNDFDIAFSKINFWFEKVVSRCVAFNKDNETAYEMLLDETGQNRTSNHLMICPDDPSDDHLATLFQAKMNALANGVITFGAVRVKSNNNIGLVFTFVGDSEKELPTDNEWLTDHNYFSQAWWNRNDGSTLDVTPSTTTDVSEEPSWSYKLDFIDNAIKPKQASVIRPTFVPTLINGGKSNDDDTSH